MQDILSQVHISDLVEQTDIQDNDVFPIDSTTDTLKVKASTLKQYIGGELASGKIDKTEKGAVNGVATLDGNGLVPSSQLPSFVDDVLEGLAQNPTQTPAGTYSADGFILTGEATPCVLEEGKTYVDTLSNIQYRWTGTGSNLVSMGSGLVLGETQYSAYAGNKGKANADAISALQSGKVDKVDGKGLSTEDFTTEEKQKLATLVVGENYAELSEAYAIGTRNGQPVTSGDVAYHNNSKYHAEQSQASAILSGSYMNIAGLSAESAKQSEIRSGSFANIAGVSAENAVDNALKSEGFAVGKQHGTDVGSTSPYYHNNAEYFKNLAEEAAAQAGALDMTGATDSTDGAHGLVPAPLAGDQNKVLKGNGTWEYLDAVPPTLIENAIAPIENSNIATNNYVRGAQFIKNNYLCVALTNISVGDALVLDTNYTYTDDVTEQLYETNVNINRNVKNLIAQIEHESTAENAYDVGDQFVYGGVLCKAIATINQGDTFTLGTNYQLANDITTQIKAMANAMADPIEAIVNVYGSKNLLPNIATSQVINGITFTVNSDGSITANGTATSQAVIYVTQSLSLPQSTYVLSGCPSDGGDNTYYMVAKNGNTWLSPLDKGDGAILVNTPITAVAISIQASYTANNIVFKPMIRDARITDPTYVPYAMTNRELTTKIGIKDCIIENNTNEQTFYYPAGMTLANCCLIGAKVYTKYGTWVDLSYDGSLTYWGKFRLLNGYFGFTPTSAGNAERIIFVFYRLY